MGIFLISIIGASLLAALCAVTLWFALEVVCGLKRLRPLSASVLGGARVAILIPAHNEEAVIERTLSGLQEALASDVRIVVVADNCSDSTGDLARLHKTEVVERFNTDDIGKGFALDHGRAFLRSDPPEVVIVLDADGFIDDSSVRELAAACLKTGSACQAINLLSPQPCAPPLVRISTFAFLIKNKLRQRGLQRLAGRVHLTGTGMAFPWRVFDEASLASASIVEDLQLGLDLAAAGRPPQLVDNAAVWSQPADKTQTLVQRRRWEGGFLATAWATAPKSIVRAAGSGDWRGVAASLDLLVPPLALLMILDVAAVAAFAPVVEFTAISESGKALPVLVLVQLAAIVIAGSAILAAWVREGREYIDLRTLAQIPIYVFHKIPFYFALAIRGAPKRWTRTER